MALRLVAAAVLFGPVSGCALGPGYARPGGTTPAAFVQSAPAGPVWPDKAWWTGFRSADLDRLEADAEAGSFDIQAALARVRQADAQVRVSGAALLPSVTGNGQQSWQRRGSSFGGRDRFSETRTSQLEVSISYEVDLWGRVAAIRDGAASAALFSRYDQQTVALSIVSSVATTWFTALAFQDRLAVAERNLKDAEEIQRAIQARLDAGTASALDVAQQGALVAGLRAIIPSFRSNAQQQINALGVLTGRLPEDIRVSPGTLATLSLPEVMPGLASDLLLRRPDIAASEANLLTQNANLRVARANFYPQITLTGSGGFQSAALQSLFSPASVLATAAGSVTQTIFDNGLKSAQYDQSAARYDELVADYRRTVTQAFTDVENALTAYRYTTEQEVLERDAVAVAQRAADIARAQLLAGTSDIVVALQAQNTLFNDLDALTQIRLSRFNALVALYKALGGGWTISDTARPEPRLFQGIL